MAGRMPGRMNVLLAGSRGGLRGCGHGTGGYFAQTDVVMSSAPTTSPTRWRGDKRPIYGMPILDVDQARTVVVVKRSLVPASPGFNPLFARTTP
ncbi:hypothetical protein DSL92_03640 [Billgrantia gudaonensis]|uniref:proton-translocating NAD(P)(+) transhydrogenase n=1 Tax=Billgrantia gudaonensis TaxID=376427 RepID=A0A432JJU6_9GAMM|nr:hypothetical protein DSL92_03640 [Halomonas gudaonensis]